MAARHKVGAVVLALLIGGCSSQGPSYKAVAPTAVILAAEGTPTTVAVGLIVSGSSAPGQGSDLAAEAAGATVAAFRLSHGSRTVTLDVVDDQGTSAGALKAITKLVADHVSGVVAATTGDHLDAALALAAYDNLPVLAPYLAAPVPSAATTWYLGAQAKDIHSAIKAGLALRHLTSPFVLSGDGTAADVIGLAPPFHQMSYATDATADAIAAPVLSAAQRHSIDSVVIGGSAERQAQIVAALQGKAPGLQIVLTPEAVRAAFGDGLGTQAAKDGTATTAGAFFTVGSPSTDALAQGNTDVAGRMAALLTAVALAASEQGTPPYAAGYTRTGGARDLLHPASLSFGQVGAATADAGSHDAVIALARAAEKAKSADPALVLAELRNGFRLHADGLAGPDLDFRTPWAAGSASLVTLQSTARDPGTRVLPPSSRNAPGTATASTEQKVALWWFALPTSAG